MERKQVVCGNWKMHKTSQEAVDYINRLAPLVTASKSNVLLSVPFTSITKAVSAAQNTKITIGAQNVHPELEGAFTGEISSIMLRAEGADFVVIGHSERRQLFKETDEFINKKVIRSLEDDLIPILCVGETAKQRKENQTEKLLQDQIEKGLKNIPESGVQDLIIAYEPVWAIGTGHVATPEMAQEAHAFIRKLLTSVFSKKVAQKIPILYGGSVKPDNFKKIIEQKDIDGALVGGASLEPEAFAQIVNLG